MEPIVTLPYSEWLVAQQLIKALPASQGYSVYAPLSRQEKGVDLLLARRLNGTTRAATLQVKFSRAYEGHPGAKYRFTTWFRVFPVSERADFFVLASLYPRIDGRGRGTKSSWWLPMLLLFRRDEIAELMSSLRGPSGKVESMFYFSFNEPDRVMLTRGAPEHRDVSSFRFAARLRLLKEYLACA
jgi:hypothetical protein